MKHFFTATTFAVLVFFGFTATSQNTSPYWSLAGNNNSNAMSKIGTTNIQNLRIVTNNVTRIFVNTNGSVGINTLAPRAALYVSGANKDTAIYGVGRLYGVVGYDTIKTGSYTAGVYGSGYSNGVIGVGEKVGVYGESGMVNNAGWGVYGRSQYGIGVRGEAVSTAVEGDGEYYGVVGVGQEIAVSGRSGTANPDEMAIYTKSWGVYGLGYYGMRAEGNVFGINATATNDTGKAVYGKGNYGVFGEGVNFGVFARGRTGIYGTTPATGGDAIRVLATGTSSSWGVNASSTSSYGIWARTSNAASYAGYFSGNVFSTGTYQSSDERLKRNIKPVTNGLDIINKLQPKYYEFRNDGDYAKMNLPAGMHYGLMAQEVEKILPGLIKETQFDLGKVKASEQADGKLPSQLAMEEKIDFKAMNYTELIPILIKATQELNSKVDELARQNGNLKEEIKLLKNMGAKNETAIMPLLQNVPNPVSESTTIGYALPDICSKAVIVIADKSGQTINQLAISGKGKGSVNTSVSSLSAGAYSYSLLVDGVVVATKQMVVVK